MATIQNSFLGSVSSYDARLQELAAIGTKGGLEASAIEISGDDLTMAEMVAVSCYGAQVRVSKDDNVRKRVEESVAFLKRHLDEGQVVYGVNTGVGGSADTRSNEMVVMQKSLIQHQNCGVLLPSDIGQEELSTGMDLDKHSLPRAVVRGAMLARCNSLLRGHSAVRLELMEGIVRLLNMDSIPIVPLRGSISASGDLSPLSYIAGTLEGNPDIYLDCKLEDGKRGVLNAREALQRVGVEPVTMAPKEGLGLMNGTAFSCSAGALALHETQYLALAAQVLTGMATEALRGSADNYHPFISKTRPHGAQAEVAVNIRRQLDNSQFVVGKTAKTAGLYQDRYGLRTAPQWIGPQIEDITLAVDQLSVELNSTTDNPLIDVDEEAVHHGGNFQAASITSAVEKARLALQMMGKLMFAQTSELINPMLNAHLTPNLSFDDPGMSFTFKGIDINMAAYMSELAFLANPVSSHVQSAEMHNQAVNSLALISARYTLQAVELVSLMTAASLYTVCQGLDLHALHIDYMALIEQGVQARFDQQFRAALSTSSDSVLEQILGVVRATLISLKSLNTPERARATAEATIVPLTKAMSQTSQNSPFAELGTWVEALTELITTSIRSTRTNFATSGPSTPKYIGDGSKVMYNFIRNELNVALHRGLVEEPAYSECELDGIAITPGQKVTIGSRISIIYAAIRSGRMGSVLVESLK